MLKKLSIFLVLFLSSCGWHFQNGELLPTELRTLRLESNDPYSEMSIVMRKQLQLNNVALVESPNVPVLRLNKTNMNDEVASIFKRGREAEKILILEVEATVYLNHSAYPIMAKVNRTFFDNSRAALAKSVEREVVWNDMREQAARQLISRMVALQQQVKTKVK
ncbi:LPS assembly lipoprotein LptE [Rodentibacter caecimuris]|uniref:LPS-assembly lipoprotein LptE n=1 Tax=Rodentibacter caecimuris TaxID=1796644 RepID=A0ABX3KW90_9PAST|nr:hypothetical protein BKG89_09780 [Rodentibacter heylii]